MSDLTKILTPARTAKLKQAGVTSLFDLLTTFPRRLQKVEPLTTLYNQSKADSQYFFTGQLVRIEQRKGRRPFLVLHFEGAFSFSGYYFVTSRYIYSQLKQNLMYQVLVVKQQSFWSIKSLAPVKDTMDTDNFILGKAEQKQYLVPIYPKTGPLKSSYYLATHRQIPKLLYILDMEGLIPTTDLIPTKINLYNIHHPTSLEAFNKSRQHWLSLKVFLKLCLIKYVSIDQRSLSTQAGELDLAFLKELSGSLPYSLSTSQKNVIWDILQEISIHDI